MKQIFALLLCFCLLMSACGKAPEQIEPSTNATTQPTTQPAEETDPPFVEGTEEATRPVEETTVATIAPGEEYKHPLTGEVTEETSHRPVAVVINNISVAMPLMGVGSADILFEHMAEGGGTITRLLGVFTDLESVGKIGSIRSARTYFLDLARNFKAPIVHCGASDYANANIRSTKYLSFNQFAFPKYFYRDQERLDAGYSMEHTMISDGSLLYQGLIESGFKLDADAEADYGMAFAEEVALDGASAKKVTVQFYGSSGKLTVMSYDAQDGVYYGTQKWKSKQAQIADGNTEEAVPFKNVLILNVKTSFAEDNYHMITKMTGEGTGYLACNGEYVPIIWHRESTSEPFTYTMEDGSAVNFGVGKTYVAMRPTRSPDVIFE